MRSANPLVSVVILSWNRKGELRTTLQHVRDQKYSPCEIVVVDNGSADGTPAMVRALFPKVQVLALPQNVGIEGLNIGLRVTHGDIIVLLDDDSYPLPGALAQLAEVFQRDLSLGIAACQIEGPPGWFEAKWPWYREAPGTEVPTFVGCGVGIRRKALEDAGYFDGSFFLYHNELDLAARVMDAGYTVRYFPEIKLVHAVSSTNRAALREEYYSLRNLLWIIWKYFPWLQVVPLSCRVVCMSIGYRVFRRDLNRIWVAVRSVWGAFVQRGTPIVRRPLSRRTRQRLMTYIDLWYPPPLPLLRAYFRRAGSKQ